MSDTGNRNVSTDQEYIFNRLFEQSMRSENSVETQPNFNGVEDEEWFGLHPADIFLLVYLSVTAFLGILFNLIKMREAINEFRERMRLHQEDIRAAFLLLKIQLSVGNMFVLVIYNPTIISWLILFNWYGGDFMCRCIHFLLVFAFNSMSYSTAALAVDRCRNVAHLSSIDRRRDVLKYNEKMNPVAFVQRLVCCGWGLAAVLSLIQWVVWNEVTIPGHGYEDVKQCVSYWDSLRIHTAANLSTDRQIFEAMEKNDSDQYYMADSLFVFQAAQIGEPFLSEKLYVLTHLSILFWLPLLVIFTCYVRIIWQLWRLSRNPFATKAGSINRRESFSKKANSRDDTLKNNVEASVGPVVELSSLLPDSTRMTSNLRSCEEGRKKRSQRGMSGVPNWRNQMRSKMFRSSAFIVAAYVLLWLPYNVFALAVFFDPGSESTLSIHLDRLKHLTVLNAVLNPLLY